MIDKEELKRILIIFLKRTGVGMFWILYVIYCCVVIMATVIFLIDLGNPERAQSFLTLWWCLPAYLSCGYWLGKLIGIAS